jgi:exopolyphosphatase / guanosine-5'-triphosphate,3'-diphosphate pyrophosphatase
VSRRVAAVDQGTNSTRLLVADVSAEGVTEVQRLLTITRLGDGVDSTGRLSDASIGRVMSTLDGYADAANQEGAEVVLLTATSAVRDASNGPEFLADVERRYGFTTRVLTGEDEARMTFRGVTSAHPPDGTVLVSDIGGGSTELIAGGPEGLRWATSLDIGCVRLSERFLTDDPPTPESLAALREQAASHFPSLAGDARLIGVAGTITTLATIDLGLDEEVPELVDGHVLRADTVERELARLADLPLAERRQVRGLMPERAPTIVAGAAILAELMRAAQRSELTVSERDILHGAALEAAELPR